MDDKEKLSYLKAIPMIGEVAAEKMLPYVIALSHRRKTNSGQYVNEERPYLGADGRIAWARADHVKQGKKLDIVTAIISEDERLLRVRAIVTSEVYGTAMAHADSKLGSQGIEGQRPLEVCETSAVARALGMLGYGLLPGTGLTSAEDMEQVQKEQKANGQEMRRVPVLSETQVAQLVAMTQEWTGIVDPEKAFDRLAGMTLERFGRAPHELDQDDGLAIVVGLKKAIADKAAKKPTPASEQAAQGESVPYLANATAWRSTMAHLVNNGAREGDAKATMEQWLEDKYTHEQVQAELAKGNARRYQQRFFAIIKELDLSKEAAYKHLSIEHLEELQGQPLDVVKGRLIAAKAATPA